MDPGMDHTEWSKSDSEGEISCGTPYMRNLKRNDTNELIYKTESDMTQQLNNNNSVKP